MMDQMNDKQDPFTFAEDVDRAIRNEGLKTVITLSAGTGNTTKIEDSLHLGPVVRLYALVRGLTATLEHMVALANLDPKRKEEFIDELLQMVKEDLIAGGLDG